jgi:hypothetical protein
MVLGSTILSNFSRAYAAGPGEGRPESSRGSVFCCRRDRILSRSAVFLVPARYCWGRVCCEAPVSCIALIRSIAPATCLPSPISTDLGRVRGWADTLPVRKEHPERPCRSLGADPSRTPGRSGTKTGRPLSTWQLSTGRSLAQVLANPTTPGRGFENGWSHRLAQLETGKSGSGTRWAATSSPGENYCALLLL